MVPRIIKSLTVQMLDRITQSRHKGFFPVRAGGGRARGRAAKLSSAPRSDERAFVRLERSARRGAVSLPLVRYGSHSTESGPQSGVVAVGESGSRDDALRARGVRRLDEASDHHDRRPSSHVPPRASTVTS